MTHKTPPQGPPKLKKKKKIFLKTEKDPQDPPKLKKIFFLKKTEKDPPRDPQN